MNGMTLKELEEVWNKIFPIKIGTKVKVVRIWAKEHLKYFPVLGEYIGKTGEVVRIENSWLDKEGWWVASAERPNAKKVLAYQVNFGKENEWCFMREDLEIVGKSK